MAEKKSKSKELKEKLFLKNEHAINRLKESEVKRIDKFSEGYKRFLNESKTERESVRTALAILKNAGFEEMDYDKKYKPGDKVYTINREKAIVFSIIGEEGLSNGARLAIAHVDSPRLDLKPNPLYETDSIAFFKTHYYGGIKKYQWMAIPLSLHGQVITASGETITVNIGEDKNDPQFCVTDLLPHLAKDQMEKPMRKIFTGEDLNILIGSRPFKSDETSEAVKLNILNILNEKYNIVEEDFLSAELEAVPAFSAVDIGFDRSMVGAYGQDDRVCAYAALMATVDTKPPKNTCITVLIDKEEIGSDGNTGMKSEFVKHFIEDLAEKENLCARHVLAKSKCLSADVNAAFDPNYSSAYEKNNSSHINHGAVITKYTGSGGKSGTSDASAEFMASIRKLLNDHKIIWQIGELGKVDGGGGGTIAKFVANLNLDVVDLGVPVLSMHAPFEVISKIDLYMTYKTIKTFYEKY